MRPYQEWGKTKKKIDSLEPTHFVRNNLVIRTIKKLSRSYKISKILDVKCEGGYLANMVANLGYKITAIDTSKESIAYAEKHNPHPNISYLKQDVNDHEGTYDLVMAIEAANRIIDDVEFFRNCYNLLSRKGILLITVPAHEEYRTDFDNRIGNVRRYSKEELTEKLKQAGFKVIISKYYGYPRLHWYYFNIYLKASLKRRRLQEKKPKLIWFFMPLINKYFINDIKNNDPRAINLLMIANKK